MLINSVNASTYGFVLSEPPGWLDTPSLQTPTAPIITRGPVIIGSPIVQPKRLTLRGYVQGATAALARTNLDALKLALSFPPVKIIFDDTSTRYHALYLESFVVPPASQGAFLAKGLRVDANFMAQPPYSFDNDTTTVSGSAALPMGTGPARPVVTLSGASNPTITLKDKDGNSITSMALTCSGTIVIDHDQLTIVDDGVANMAALTSGDFFVIDPADPKYQGTGPSIAASGVSSHSTTYRKVWR